MTPPIQKTIYHLIPRIEYGGTERMLTQIMTSSAISSEWRQVLYVMKGDHAENMERLIDTGCEIRQLPMGKGRIQSALGIFKSIMKLRRDCHKEKPDAIMGWLYYGNILASMIRPKSALLFHNIRNSGFNVKEYQASLRLALRINARLSHLADMTIFNSHVGRHDHIGHGFCSRRNIVLHNGIDSDDFMPSAEYRKAWRQQHGFKAKDKVILTVGRNDPQKRYDQLLILAETFPEHHFVAIGEGVEKLNFPKNVLKLGYTNNINTIYPAADIILSASSFGEGFQNVVAEGMAAGLVPVCHDAGDIRILVGEAGYVANDYDDLTQKLGHVLTMPPKAMKAAATASRDQILNNFSRAQFDRNFLNLLATSLLADKGASR